MRGLMRVPLAASIVLISLASTVVRAQPPLDRVIKEFPPGQPVDVGVPLTIFQLEWALDRIASTAQAPVGFEGVPGERWVPKPAVTKIVLTGMRVREAL